MVDPNKEGLDKDSTTKLKKLLEIGVKFNIYIVPRHGYYCILRMPNDEVIHGKRHFKTRKELLTTVVNHLL